MAVVVPRVEAYESTKQGRQILRLLGLGDREIASGRGHALDEVLVEADRLL